MNTGASSRGSSPLSPIVETPRKEVVVPSSKVVGSSSSEIVAPSSSPLSVMETPSKEIVASSPPPESGHRPLVPRKKDGSWNLSMMKLQFGLKYSGKCGKCKANKVKRCPNENGDCEVVEQYTDTGEDPKNPLQISDNDDEGNTGETSGNVGEGSDNAGDGSSKTPAAWSTVNSEPRASET